MQTITNATYCQSHKSIGHSLVHDRHTHTQLGIIPIINYQNPTIIIKSQHKWRNLGKIEAKKKKKKLNMPNWNKWKQKRNICQSGWQLARLLLSPNRCGWLAIWREHEREKERQQALPWERDTKYKMRNNKMSCYSV